MMEGSILERGRQIGLLHAEQTGLFWQIACKITADTEPVRRIYVIKGWASEYLGIPDARGILNARLPLRRLPDGFDTAIASRVPRGDWSPWCGSLEEIEVDTAYFRRTDGGILLALPPEEALKFPAWAEQMQTEKLFGEEMASLLLTPDGQLPLIEKEMGGESNEDSDKMDCDGAAFGDGADDAADVGFGLGRDEAHGREADRADL